MVSGEGVIVVISFVVFAVFNAADDTDGATASSSTWSIDDIVAALLLLQSHLPQFMDDDDPEVSPQPSATIGVLVVVAVFVFVLVFGVATIGMVVFSCSC